MFYQRNEGKDSSAIALSALAMYELTAKNHKDLRATGGGSVLLISYAALVWDTLKTAKRIERFMPCLGPINDSFVPRLGRDIIEKNRWKAHGSVLDYGKSNPPKKLHIDYSLEEERCTGAYPPAFDTMPESEQLIQRIGMASDYLHNWSEMHGDVWF